MKQNDYRELLGYSFIIFTINMVPQTPKPPKFDFFLDVPGFSIGNPPCLDIVHTGETTNNQEAKLSLGTTK